jgi:hypothetical protein
LNKEENENALKAQYGTVRSIIKLFKKKKKEMIG